MSKDRSAQKTAPPYPIYRRPPLVFLVKMNSVSPPPPLGSDFLILKMCLGLPSFRHSVISRLYQMYDETGKYTRRPGKVIAEASSIHSEIVKLQHP
ncbi:hypothetical protein J6590_047745 [Homalodisca vitripennis]|nr:hypothetical protein J6590_047745 [Homalodisca vitripennis]